MNSNEGIEMAGRIDSLSVAEGLKMFGLPPLPASAKSIHRAYEAGIDAAFWLRFDIDPADLAPMVQAWKMGDGANRMVHNFTSSRSWWKPDELTVLAGSRVEFKKPRRHVRQFVAGRTASGMIRVYAFLVDQ